MPDGLPITPAPGAGEASPQMGDPVPGLSAAAAAAAGPAGAQGVSAGGAPDQAMMRLQKLVTFGGLTVELFEDVQEVHAHLSSHWLAILYIRMH